TKCSILGLPRCRGIPFAASRLETFTPSIATNSSNTNPSEAPPITAAPVPVSECFASRGV
ncbi:MAG: hypothetical protein ACK5BF_08095, partial [Hyphomonadaceae bacterium]|nr:hypothetical protein [Aquidulcibacter sp.]